jgi:uncharacterized protein
VTLIGRSRERSSLGQAMASSEAELVAVYGRRRVGKTFLIREVFRDALCFELVGIQLTMDVLFARASI